MFSRNTTIDETKKPQSRGGICSIWNSYFPTEEEKRQERIKRINDKLYDIGVSINEIKKKISNCKETLRALRDSSIHVPSNGPDRESRLRSVVTDIQTYEMRKAKFESQEKRLLSMKIEIETDANDDTITDEIEEHARYIKKKKPKIQDVVDNVNTIKDAQEDKKELEYTLGGFDAVNSLTMSDDEINKLVDGYLSEPKVQSHFHEIPLHKEENLHTETAREKVADLQEERRIATAVPY